VLGRGLLAAAHVQVARWDAALRHVERVQEKTLARILRRSCRTEIGARWGFDALRTYADFAARVPVGDYDTFAPFFDRMRRGERGVLVPEPVRHYGNSSGSSTHGKSKFLPIGETQIGHQRRAGADTLMRWLVSSKTRDFLSGYTLGLFPPTTMREDGPTLVTSNPALMVTRLPAFTRPVYLPHDDVKTVADYETKLAIIAERYLDWDVRAVTGTTCWFSLLFERVLDAARRRGLRARAVTDVWPGLRVMIGGGVSAEPYRPILAELAGPAVTLVDTYNATEGGIYAASDFSGERGMLVLPHRGTFFEFVPIEERGKARPTRVPLWAVARDVPYSIVVTTTSGLYAYELGDIVRFPSTDPLRIEFMGRLNGCLSLTQELMTHVEIERAVAHAVSACPCRTVDFGAAGDVGASGTAKSRYVLYVEFAAGAEPASLDVFAAAFDAGLCAQNRVYREHRAGDVALLPPRVVPLVAGGAQRFLDVVTRGNVQGKFPRILDGAREAKLKPFIRGTSVS
jgi:hypothetical protein